MHFWYSLAIFSNDIFFSCVIREPVIPSPDGHGWTKDGDMLTVEWMKGPPALDVVLEFLSCKCSKECKAPTCPCAFNGFKCTEACRLSDCSNFSAQDLQYAQDNESDYNSDA